MGLVSLCRLVALMLFFGTAYLKKVVEKFKAAGKDEAFIKGFQKGVQEYYTKKIVPNFSDLDFYVGESMDTDGMYVVFFTPREHQPRVHTDIASQGRVSQLPRGWRYALCHHLEAWLGGDEGLSAGARHRTGVCPIFPTLLPFKRYS